VTKIVLIRHGHVEGVKPERFRGRRDIPLTRRGQAQAKAVARRVAKAFTPDHIYTSPLARCVATGAAIARACNRKARVLAALNDIDYGTWEFSRYQDARRSDPERFAAWFATPERVQFPNGESLQDVAARAADVLRFLRERHAGETVVVVGHDTVNRVLLLLLLDLPLSAYWRLAQEPCCINEIDVGVRVVLRRMNETQHLDGIRAL